MRLDAQKEWTPVLYGEYPAKVLPVVEHAGGEMCFSLHWHERMEVLRVRSGCMQVEIDGVPLTLQAGEMLIVYPGQTHAGTALSQGVCYNGVMFDLRLLKNGTVAYARYVEPLLTGAVTCGSKALSPDLSREIDALMTLPECGSVGDSLRAVGHLYTFLGLLYQNGGEQQPPQPVPEDAFAQVVDYVNRHHTEPLTAAGLSRRFGYNSSYFSRRFKQSTGLPVTQYIQLRRLETAQKLLNKTEDTVLAVAAQCGFSDVCHFTHCFTRHVGMSPTAYREGNRVSPRQVTNRTKKR